jgi:hypothetical protein
LISVRMGICQQVFTMESVLWILNQRTILPHLP